MDLSQPARLRIFSALAVRAAFDRGLLDVIGRAGIAPRIDWAPSTVIDARLRAGEVPDLVIATDDTVRGLGSAGLLDARACRPLVSSRIGIAVPAGAPHPDISTPAACFDALLAARSVAYSVSGASGIQFQALLDAHGHREAVDRRATRAEGGLVAERLVSGEADLAVQQISELRAVAGVEIVGALPAPLQTPIALSIGITGAAADNPAAHALVVLLTGGDARVIYTASGLEAR